MSTASAHVRFALPLLTACRVEVGPPEVQARTGTPTVWIYTAIYQEQVDQFDALARKELPEVHLEWFQAGSEKVAQRWEAEHAAGVSPACLVATSDPSWYVDLTQRGLLVPYVSPRALELPRAWVTPTYAAHHIDLMVLGAPKGDTDVPRSFRELGDTRWKGRFSSGDPFSSGTTFTTVSAWDRLYGQPFLSTLDQNGWVMAGGNSAVLGRIESREKPIGVVLLNNLLTKPDAAQIIFPEDGAVPIPGPLAIPTDCREQEAARKVYDWLMGDSAQRLVVASRMHSPFPGMPAPSGTPPLDQIKLAPLPDDFTVQAATNAPDLRAPRGAPTMTRRLVLVLIAVLLLAFVAVPLALLASGAGHLGAVTGEGEAIRNTVVLAIGTAALAAAVGLPVGWVAARHTLPRMVEAAMILPYAVPPYVTTVAWIVLANPTNGVLTRWLPVDIYTLPGMVLVLGLHLSPVVATAARDALGRIDPALEEAARVSGASPLATLRRITLPLAAPGILSATSFVASAAAASFGVPYLLASSAKVPVPVLTLRIYRALELQPVEGRPLAEALAIVLLVVGVALPALVRLVEGRRGYATARLARPRPTPPAGPWTLVVLGWLGVAVLLPLTTIALTSVATRFGAFDALTTQHWTTVLGEARTREALLRSGVLAAGAATVATVVGTILASVAERTPSRMVSALVALGRAPWAVPGSVLALGMILAFSQELRLIFADRLTVVLALANTPWILGIAYATKALALPLDGVRAAVRTVDRSLEEAARVAGASWLRTQLAIAAPLYRPAMLAGWVLVFASSFCEVSMSVLLHGPGTEVLGTRLFDLLSDGSPQQAAVLAMIVVAAVLAGGPILTRRARWA